MARQAYRSTRWGVTKAVSATLPVVVMQFVKLLADEDDGGVGTVSGQLARVCKRGLHVISADRGQPLKLRDGTTLPEMGDFD